MSKENVFGMEPIELTDEEQVAVDRYARAMQAMQNGVKILMEHGYGIPDAPIGEFSLLHVRVGVNSTMIETSVLQDLLVEKGIITRLEFLLKLAELMEREVQIYRVRLREANIIPPGGTLQ